jgi:hypothetical protein
MDGTSQKGINGNPADDLLSCIGAADQNLHVSLLNLGDVMGVFNRLDQHMRSTSVHLSKIEFDRDDPTYIILNLMALAHRQMRNGFILCLRRQCYDGQLLFRLGVEGTIFAYRIFKEPKLGLVWVKKDEDSKSYNREFRRPELPEGMPFGPDLREYLDYLNDYRSHPNIFNFAGTLKATDGKIELNYFDEDEVFYPTFFAYVKVSFKIVSIFRTMIERCAKVFVTSTESEFARIQDDFQKLAIRYRSKLPTPEELASVAKT